MDEVPKLPKPLTDTAYWRMVIASDDWADVDDRALFAAFVGRDPTVAPAVVAGLLRRILRLARQTAISVAKTRGITDKDGLKQVVKKVLGDVNQGIALPRGKLGKAFSVSFFGRVLNIAAPEARKIRRRRKIQAENDLWSFLYVGHRSSEDGEGSNLTRQDVLRALDAVATRKQRSTIHLLMSAWTIKEVAAIEGVTDDTVHNRVNAFVKLHHGRTERRTHDG